MAMLVLRLFGNFTSIGKRSQSIFKCFSKLLDNIARNLPDNTRNAENVTNSRMTTIKQIMCCMFVIFMLVSHLLIHLR